MGIKVQRVRIKDFKVLKNFDADFEGKSVFLMADNGRGKSSLMQAIQIALGNSDAIPPNMTGEGVVEVTKDGEPYSFSFKTKKDGKPELTVILPNGMKENKKGIIGGIVGSLEFDIDAFVKMSESTAGRKKQVEEFKKLLPKEFIDGIKAFEVKAKNIYDDRTEIGRKMTTLEGFIKESKLFGDDLKAKPVDVTSLSADLDKANTHNNKLKEVASRFEERAKAIQGKLDKIDAVKKQIEELKAEVAELERVCETEQTTQKLAEAHLAKTKPIDTTPLVHAINSASEINVKAAQAEEHNKKLSQYNVFKEEYEELTVQYEVNKQAISDAIKDFDSPVEGLTFDDEQLLYNGVPVSINSLSTSEIMELGIKMFFASNKECGLMFIENSNLIGAERFKYILDYAKKYDLQLFFEEVIRGQDELEIKFVND